MRLLLIAVGFIAAVVVNFIWGWFSGDAYEFAWAVFIPCAILLFVCAVEVADRIRRR